MKWIKKQLSIFASWIGSKIKKALKYVWAILSKKRYVGSHPKLKRFVLVNFLFVVIGFIGWNISVNMPQVSFKWSSEPIMLEQRANAKFTTNADVLVVKEIDITDCYSASQVMSKKYSVPEELLNKIIKAESGNNPLVENKVSTATGCSQWILGSWRSYGKMLWGEDFHSKNIYSPKDNVELLAWTIANYGTSPWDASRASWQK